MILGGMSGSRIVRILGRVCCLGDPALPSCGLLVPTRRPGAGLAVSMHLWVGPSLNWGLGAADPPRGSFRLAGAGIQSSPAWLGQGSPAGPAGVGSFPVLAGPPGSQVADRPFRPLAHPSSVAAHQRASPSSSSPPTTIRMTLAAQAPSARSRSPTEWWSPSTRFSSTPTRRPGGRVPPSAAAANNGVPPGQSALGGPPNPDPPPGDRGRA
jgi:hypothetical protein